MDNKYSISTLDETETRELYFVVFNICDNKYAINVQKVVEIINILKPEIPEQTPYGITGMFNYSGTMIKSIDLCPFLGLKTPNFKINNCMIIISENDECFAIHVESIETVEKFDKEKIQNIPFNSENSILKQVYKSENRLINIIDCTALLNLISQKSLQKSEINYKTLFPSDEKELKLLITRTQQFVNQASPLFPIETSLDNQYILFTMDNQNYYFDIKYIKEFISMKRLNITKLPYTPDYILGIVSVKGEFIVIINMKKFIGKGSENELIGNKLMIIEGKDFNIGFLADDIKYIKSLNNIKKTKLYPNSQNYIYAEFLENDELYSILDYDKIINDSRLYINL